jgi:hypothetical protein
MSPSVDLSSVNPCDYLADGEIAAITGFGTGVGEQHLSALPGFWDCVFFRGDSVLATVGIRREATAAADAEALVTELFPLDRDVAQVTVEGQPAYFLSCTEVWSPCRPAIALAAEPHLFVISMRWDMGNEVVAVALASAVLANLQQ